MLLAESEGLWYNMLLAKNDVDFGRCFSENIERKVGNGEHTLSRMIGWRIRRYQWHVCLSQVGVLEVNGEDGEDVCSRESSCWESKLGQTCSVEYLPLMTEAS
ncbi:hypothetical protein TSUD_382630 [Trifolium subterraneum]|uniref:Uncharacterized protein n=1 Tax=Trifolium subterraneum TaxID=3900 RepID=A0A2Z6PGQ8_TRISU|nr:hypothetical protein TSUD_382630 [Trifolium subterraneum]